MGHLAPGEIFENMLQSGACPGIRICFSLFQGGGGGAQLRKWLRK